MCIRDRSTGERPEPTMARLLRLRHYSTPARLALNLGLRRPHRCVVPRWAGLCTSPPPVNPEKREELDLADVIPGAKTPGPKLILGYTCKVCDTRSHRTISKASYENGVVLVRCTGCDNLHLIADNLGWFEEGTWNVSDYLKAQGEVVNDLTNEDNVIEFQMKPEETPA
eukprot:TRINITY_DN9539_c0_g1_i3.p1 TRINITY_DN9539_c0_g1~~TRINITY_DN9539_c0_g1_i3.p1  ORF type:complete len:169 (-),score=30.33 TRINITY_DN9539_c0_g1_i3:231-737(-)